MVFLRVYKDHLQIAEFDKAKGTLKYYSIEKFEEPPHSFSGVLYKIIDKKILFFRDEDDLFIGEPESIIRIPKNAKAEISPIWISFGMLKRLKISSGSKLIFSCTCFFPVIFPPLWLDPTGFTEREFLDPCLFIHNVINDPGRVARIFKNL